MKKKGIYYGKKEDKKSKVFSHSHQGARAERHWALFITATLSFIRFYLLSNPKVMSAPSMYGDGKKIETFMDASGICDERYRAEKQSPS